MIEICIDRPDGSVLIEWGPYIEPPDVDDAAADAGVGQALAAIGLIVAASTALVSVIPTTTSTWGSHGVIPTVGR